MFRLAQDMHCISSGANLMGRSMRVLIIAGILLFTGTVNAVDNERRSPRLKFKDGPVCMCTDGLSEKDIRARTRKGVDRKGVDKDTIENDATNKSEQLETSLNRDTEDK